MVLVVQLLENDTLVRWHKYDQSTKKLFIKFSPVRAVRQ